MAAFGIRRTDRADCHSVAVSAIDKPGNAGLLTERTSILALEPILEAVLSSIGSEEMILEEFVYTH